MKEAVIVKANVAKIIGVTLFRTALMTFFILAWWGGMKNTDNPNWMCIFLTDGLAILYAISPLRHLFDKLVYEEKKITFYKKQMTFAHPDEVLWGWHRGYYSGKRLRMQKKREYKGVWDTIFDPTDWDVSYLKNPKEQFVKHYYKTIEINE